MDRAEDLIASLETIVAQNYSNYTVYLIDMSSSDVALLESIAGKFSARVATIGLPRPRYFSFSQSRNAGARYTFSDLLLFLNADNVMIDLSVLSTAVRSLLAGGGERDWYRRWRAGTDWPEHS